MTSPDVLRLSSDHAGALAALIAAHVQELNGGSPPRPDRYWAERLLADPRIRLFGARLDGELVGFAVVHELTDCLTGLETGLLETVFVRPDRRGRGAGRELLAAIGAEGRARAWSRLRRVVETRTRPAAMSDPIAEEAVRVRLVQPSRQ